MASDPSPAPSRVEEAWALVDDWTGFRRTNPLYGLIHRIATALQAAEQRGRQEEREACCRAVCGFCAGTIDGYETAVFRRDDAWAHRWKSEFGNGSSLCRADAIRALPIDGEPKGEEK